MALIILIALPIMMLFFLDYYNLEGYNYRRDGETNTFVNWPNAFFNESFLFELTWKGRMFLLVFLWIVLIESAMDWKEFVDGKPKNRYIMIASLVCASIPTFYILATNFLGLDLSILQIGHDVFGILSVSGANEPWDFLHLYWPISCEYMVFAVFFIGAVILAYKTKGLKNLSISLTLLGGIGAAYLFDTIYPFGVFKPLQAFALPTAAVAAALFDLLGYTVRLVFPTYGFDYSLPSLTVTVGSESASVAIAWACAGVQSLLLYLIIILVFFRKAGISAFRKLAYFIIGLFGTFFVNVLRVFSIIIIMLNSGNEAGMVFHNTYGEIYSVIWILLFILLIGCIQRFMLVERTKHVFQRICSFIITTKKNFIHRVRALRDGK
ncbi:MAG: exosortase/archaeosortase family protein [Candidatus Bathyarchaeota archaeon]|nr:exosortase/archaeosortase family protein [Candidatus Bathyarchaeota archaeon]